MGLDADRCAQQGAVARTAYIIYFTYRFCLRLFNASRLTMRYRLKCFGKSRRKPTRRSDPKSTVSDSRVVTYQPKPSAVGRVAQNLGYLRGRQVRNFQFFHTSAALSFPVIPNI